jgi:hypothetical protein
MNKILPLFLAVGFAFAQEPMTFNPFEAEQQAPAVAEPAPPAPVYSSPAPVAAPSSAPAAPAGKTAFDALRGHAYNPFGIAGAANSVKDLVFLPSEINGQRFAYIAPGEGLGYAAFGGLGGSFLLGLDNSPISIFPVEIEYGNNPNLNPPLGAFILGYANSGFGVALNVSLGKYLGKTEHKNGVTESNRLTLPGDNLGLYFSLPLGGPTIYANANWLTYRLSHRYELTGSPTIPPTNNWEGFDENGYRNVDYSEYQGSLGLQGALGSLEYNGYLGVVRHVGTIDSDMLRDENSKKVSGKKAVSKDSYLEAGLGFDIGYVAVQNELGRVIIGANNIFAATYYDEIETWQDDYKAGNVMELAIAPNILTEWILMDNLLAFGGAMHPLYFNFGGSRTQARNEDISRTIVYSIPTEAFMGLRYQKTNWALEASFSTHPFEALAGNNIFANFGGFVYF